MALQSLCTHWLCGRTGARDNPVQVQSLSGADCSGRGLPDYSGYQRNGGELCEGKWGMCGSRAIVCRPHVRRGQQTQSSSGTVRRKLGGCSMQHGGRTDTTNLACAGATGPISASPSVMNPSGSSLRHPEMGFVTGIDSLYPYQKSREKPQVQPPSTTRLWPLTYEPASETRNKTAAAISSVSPGRRCGINDTRRSAVSLLL